MEEDYCDRCRTRLISPARIDPTLRREVALLLRGGDSIGAIRRLREIAGWSLGEAKGVFIHVTREPGKCQRCGTALASGGSVVCGKCRSLNYDW